MKLRKFAAFGVLVLFGSLTVYAQLFSKFVGGDNSDWWSIIRKNGNPNGEFNPQKREPAPSNFQVLGISLQDQDVFEKAIGRLGPTEAMIRGDAATARTQACYVSVREPNVYLIFEGGEVQFSYYLFSGNRPWSGSYACVKSALVTSSLQTGSGLRLGESESRVERILGEPTVRKSNHLSYWYQVPKKTSAADLAKWRRQNPGMSEKDFHENYDYYTLTADDIEATFANSKLVYLGADESETY